MEVPVDGSVAVLKALIADDAGLPKRGVEYFLGDTQLTDDTALLQDTHIAQHDKIRLRCIGYPSVCAPLLPHERRACFALAISPDSTKLIISTASEKAALYDINTSALLREYETGVTDYEEFPQVLFALHATTLFYTDSALKLYVTDYSADEEARVFPFEGATHGIDNINETQVAVIETVDDNDSSMLAIWDITTLTQLRILSCRTLSEETFQYFGVSVSPCGEHCVVGGWENITMIDLATGESTPLLRSTQDTEIATDSSSSSSSCSSSPEGAEVIYTSVKTLPGNRCIACVFGAIELWDTESRTLIRTLKRSDRERFWQDRDSDSSIDDFEYATCDVFGSICVSVHMGAQEFCVWNLDTGESLSKQKGTIPMPLFVRASPCGTFWVWVGASQEEDDSDSDEQDAPVASVEMWRNAA